MKHFLIKISPILILVLFVALALPLAVHAATPRTCAGDFNEDSVVDLTDYSLLTKDFFKVVVSNPFTDMNQDSKVDLQDYSLLVSKFLKPCVSSATATPISGGGGNAQYAFSYGKWDPADPQYAFSGPMKYPVCTKAFHDSYKVLASDGKWYPTWHPPVAVDPATGTKCAFGHDHGDDPSKSAIWSQIQEHYYYDANHNNVMDPSEQAVAGMPFGFASEQLDVYSAANGSPVMRHESIVGFKVTVGNGEADATGGQFNNNTTGGIIVPIQRTGPDGFKWTNSGASCYIVQMIHMGVFSNDALTNNLHEVAVFQDCKGPSASYDQRVAMDVMAPFGAPGEFTNLCTAQVPEDRTTPIVIGKDAMNQNYPGVRGRGAREILQRSCIEANFLVPEGKFTPNFYEEWDTSPNIVTAAGKTIMSGFNMAIDVEDTIRYYDPSKPNKMQYTQDLCYEVEPNGDHVHGGSFCYYVGLHPNERILPNSTLAGGRGIHRGMYFNPPKTDNVGGPIFWYTDPFGGKGQATPFPGSIKQRVSSTKVDYSTLGPIDPRQIDRNFNDGEGTVHAPN